MRRGGILPSLIAATLVLLAGCASPAARPPADADASAPLLVDAPGAQLARADDGATRVTWKGTADPARASGGVDPTSTFPSAYLFLASGALRLDGRATVLAAWLNATPPVALGFILQASPPTRGACGSYVTDAPSCFAIVEEPRGSSWSYLVVADEGSRPAGTIAWTLTLVARAEDLPHEGPPIEGPSSLQFAAAPVDPDDTRASEEPTLAIGADGTAFVALEGRGDGLWRLRPGGTAFEHVDLGPLTACTRSGGIPLLAPASWSHFACGDSDVAASGADVYYTFHGEGVEGVASSHDGGASWVVQPIASGADVHTDRAWVVAHGTRAWLTFLDPSREQGGLASVTTIDGGHAWLPTGRIPEAKCNEGSLALAPDGTLLQFGCAFDPRGPGVAASKDGGLTWAWHRIAPREGHPEAWLAPFVNGAVDASGTAYAVWSEPRADDSGVDLMLSRSADDGATWSPPTRVNAADGAFVLASVTAGAAGHVAIAAYATRSAASAYHARGDWYLVVLASEDADAAALTWAAGVASPDPVARGPVCVTLTCINGQVTDVIGVQADPSGALHVAFVDVTGDRDRVLYASQTAGPTLGRPSVEKSGGA